MSQPPDVPLLHVPAALRRDAVVGAVRRAWRSLEEEHGLGSGARVLIGCSGGPDSTALLLALWGLRAELRIDLYVISVDHQLRPGSGAEASSVCAVAARLGIPAAAVAVRVPAGPSTAALAREARYEAIAREAQRIRADVVAVGHTRDDQAETMLMRWLGGAGLRGLVGMSPSRRLIGPRDAARAIPATGDGPAPLLVRPLLATARAEIERFLAHSPSLVTPLPFFDPSNACARFQRSRVRHQLLPVLRQEEPRLDAHLGELSAQLRDDADCLDALADAELRRLQLPEAGEGRDLRRCLAILPVRELGSLPRALFARVVLRAAGGGLARIHLDALWRLCQSTSGSRSLDLPERRAERRYDRLLILDASGPASGPPSASRELLEEVLVPGPGDFTAAGLHLRLSWRLVGPSEPRTSTERPDQTGQPDQARQIREAAALGPSRAWLALTDADFPLVLRGPRRGDRICLAIGPAIGASRSSRSSRFGAPPGCQHKKLSDVLIDLKVPRSERARIRVLATRDRILWLPGLLPAAPLPSPASPRSEQRLLLAELIETGSARATAAVPAPVSDGERAIGAAAGSARNG
jgi:tRNA(Ile)-lysidine synthase